MAPYRPEDIQVGWWAAECCVLDLEHITTQARRDEIVADLIEREREAGHWYCLSVWPTAADVFTSLHDDQPEFEGLLRQKLGMAP